jgi:hypothetical protein
MERITVTIEKEFVLDIQEGKSTEEKAELVRLCAHHLTIDTEDDDLYTEAINFVETNELNASWKQ